MFHRQLILIAALSLAPLVSPAAETDSKVVAFAASVRVDVDASGKPVKVEAPADLPDAIRSYIESRVATWQYQPARLNGVPAAATTYVSVNACAVPTGDSYRLGLDFAGNGPRRANDQAFLPPDYPEKAMWRGTEAKFLLIFKMEPDGKASIEDVEKSEFHGQGGRTDFLPMLKRWVTTIRFDPELVAGKPVASRIRMPVEFTMLDRGRDMKVLREEFQAGLKKSRECQVAAGANDMKPVAMESVVKITPIPAS